MKKVIIFIALMLCSIGITIFGFINRPYINWFILLGLQILSVYGIIGMFFSEKVCRFWNKVNSFFNRNSYNEKDDEPSTFAIRSGQVFGFIMFILQFSILF